MRTLSEYFTTTGLKSCTLVVTFLWHFVDIYWNRNVCHSYISLYRLETSRLLVTFPGAGVLSIYPSTYSSPGYELRDYLYGTRRMPHILYPQFAFWLNIDQFRQHTNSMRFVYTRGTLHSREAWHPAVQCKYTQLCAETTRWRSVSASRRHLKTWILLP